MRSRKTKTRPARILFNPAMGQTAEMAQIHRDDPRLVHGPAAVSLCTEIGSFDRLLVWNDQWGYVPAAPGVAARLIRLWESVVKRAYNTSMIAGDWANATQYYAVLR